LNQKYNASYFSIFRAPKIVDPCSDLHPNFDIRQGHGIAVQLYSNFVRLYITIPDNRVWMRYLKRLQFRMLYSRRSCTFQM